MSDVRRIEELLYTLGMIDGLEKKSSFGDLGSDGLGDPYADIPAPPGLQENKIHPLEMMELEDDQFANDIADESFVSDNSLKASGYRVNVVPHSVRFKAPHLNPELDKFKAEAEMTDSLLKQYKGGDKQALNSLYGLYQGQLDRLIQQQSNGRIPSPAVRAHSFIAFKKAVDTFEPGGKSFYNHFVDNHFRGVQNRLRPYSGFSKVPTRRSANLDAVDNIRTDLELSLGREPTQKEIVDEYKELYSKTLSASTISKMVKELGAESRGSKELDDSYLVDQNARMYSAALRARDLFPKHEQKLFNAAFIAPMEGSAYKSQRELSAEFGMSTSTLGRKIQEYRTAIQKEHNALASRQ